VNSAFAGVSQAIALVTRRESTMIAVANFISLPLLFLSSTFLARSQMPHWMRIAARFNPVNWGVNAARAVVLPDTDWGSVGIDVALLLALTAATAGLATWAFRSYQGTL
jgi:ABC-2 type transport system permease protein